MSHKHKRGETICSKHANPSLQRPNTKSQSFLVFSRRLVKGLANKCFIKSVLMMCFLKLPGLAPPT